MGNVHGLTKLILDATFQSLFSCRPTSLPKIILCDLPAFFVFFVFFCFLEAIHALYLKYNHYVFTCRPLDGVHC